MGYFVGSAQTNGTTGVAGLALNMPLHEAGDVLVVITSVDSGTATYGGSALSTVPSAPANPVTSGTICYLHYRVATSNVETFTLTTGDAFTAGVYCFRQIDNTTPFDGVAPNFAAVAASSNPTNASITTTTANCLVFYAIFSDGITPQVLSDPGVMFIDGFDSTGTTATTSSHQAAAWYVQRTAGATPTASWQANSSSAYVRLTLALRNASGGRVPAYIDDVTSPGTRIHAGQHVATLNNISFTGAGAGSLTGTIVGKTVTVGAAVDGADFGINVYANAFTTAAAQTATTALTGPELVLTGGRNMSSGLLMGSIIAGTPKMGAFGLGTFGQGGCIIRVGSAATFWNAYQVASRDSQPAPDQRCVWAIQPGYTGTIVGIGSGGSANTSAVTHIQFLRNAPSFSSQTYNSEIHLVNTQVVAGGDSTTPVDIAGLIEVGKSFRLPVIQKAGANGAVSFAPIQIGGGDAVYFQVDAGALQFPRRSSQTARELAFHAGDNVVGITFAGKSGDTIIFTNSVITSPNSYFFTISASATSAATWDFSGLVVVNALVTLRNVMTFTGMSFSQCSSITASSCALSECTINKVGAASDSFVNNTSTTLNNCTIDVTQVTAGNRWTTVTVPSIFSNCTFTGSASAGHAIRMTSDGTFSFTGNVFNNFGTSTSAALWNDCTPTTVNYTGSGGTALLISSTTPAAGQSFTTGGAGNLAVVSFNLRRNSTQTGTVCAKIYAHSGTFGTSSVPTGAALATSASIDISLISNASFNQVNFQFNTGGMVALSGATNYVAVVELTSTGGSGGVTVQTDASPAHAGNGSTYNGSTWAVYATGDLAFAVHVGSKIILNIAGGGSTPTVRNTLGCTTEINNAVTLSVTVKNASGVAIQNARVAIYKSSDNTLILNSLTDASGVVSTAYAYVGDESIYVRVRKTSTGTTRYVNNDSSGTITSGGFSSTVTLLTDTIAAV
jgi:hypothetical protein